MAAGSEFGTILRLTTWGESHGTGIGAVLDGFPAGMELSQGDIQKYLESEGFEVTGAEFTRIPNDLKDVTPEQRATIEKMVEKLEDFDDVQTVHTNMKPAEE